MGPDAVAILLGARLVTRSNDTEFPFRQDSDFWYLTGFDHPHAVRRAAHRRRAALHALRRAARPRRRDLDRLPAGGRRRAGATSAPTRRIRAKSCPRRFRSCSRRRAASTTCSAATPSWTRGSSGSSTRCGCARGVGLVPASEIVDPRAILHEMRLRKAAEELELLRRAVAISAEAHRAAARIAQGGALEYELEAVIDYTFRRRGAARPRLRDDRRRRRATPPSSTTSTNDQPLADGDAGADRRRLRATRATPPT